MNMTANSAGFAGTAVAGDDLDLVHATQNGDVSAFGKLVGHGNVAKILGNTLRIVEKHYSTFSQARQDALTAEIEKAWKLS